MTLGEVNRFIKSRLRVYERDMKQRAIDVYKLADLIGYSVGRIHNKNNTMPSLEDSFPHLFKTEEYQQQKEEQEIERFKAQLLQFANSHNDKMKGVKTE